MPASVQQAAVAPRCAACVSAAAAAAAGARNSAGEAEAAPPCGPGAAAVPPPLVNYEASAVKAPLPRVGGAEAGARTSPAAAPMVLKVSPSEAAWALPA